MKVGETLSKSEKFYKTRRLHLVQVEHEFSGPGEGGQGRAKLSSSEN